MAYLLGKGLSYGLMGLALSAVLLAATPAQADGCYTAFLDCKAAAKQDYTECKADCAFEAVHVCRAGCSSARHPELCLLGCKLQAKLCGIECRIERSTSHKECKAERHECAACADRSDLLCDAIAPPCADDMTLTIQGGCWSCVNTDTCEPDPPGACCDPASEPGANGNPLCFEGHACCPDGTWACSVGDGQTFPCGGELTTGPFGEACEACCDPLQEPGKFGNPLCFEGHSCCGSGQWQCNQSNGQSSCDVLGVVCEKDLCEDFTQPGCIQTGCPDGQFCDTTVGCNPSACSCDPNTGQIICTADCGGGTCVPEPPGACCDPLEEPGTHGNPLCFEGHACCPDGTWACSIGDGQTFPCGGELTTGPFGEACEACCDPLQEPGKFGNPLCFEGHSCCGSGQWQCNQSNGQSSCDVLGVVCEKDLCEDFTQPGCIQTGCPDGQICDTTVGCNPSACSCDPNTGQIICTADCGGGTCVPEPPGACCDPLEEPGTHGNPFCFEGHACCPDGTWACSIGDGQTFPCGGELTTGPFGEACEACCDPLEEPGKFGNPFCFEGHSCCGSGQWQCNQGNGQSSCDVLGIVCETDLCEGFTPPGCVQTGCPDGQICDKTVGCNPSFCSCDPTTGLIVCTDDCGGGTCVPEPPAACCDPLEEPGTNGNPLCFEGHACCPDGTWACSIGDGQTFPCGGELTTGPFGEACDACCDPLEEPGAYGNPFCFEGHSCCGSGQWQCNQGNGQSSCDVLGIVCETDLCEGFTPPGCVQTGCPDGQICDTTVGCNPSFCSCDPTTGLIVCTDDCGGGTCVPEPPAACCDPLEEPGTNGNPLCFEGHACCPDGTWACSIGDGQTFPCGGELTTGPFGEACEACCDPLEEPGKFGNPFCFEGHSCCGSGQWQCNQGNGQSSCDVLGIVREKDLCEGFTPPGCVQTGCPDGQICDKTVGCNPSFCSCDPTTGLIVCTDDCGGGTCVPEPPAACCDPLEEPGTNGNPLCFEGHACCPDGTWACSIGDGQTFPCGGELTTGPFGEACEACCDPLEEPGAYGNPLCFEGHSCCGSGQWQCNQGNGQSSCDVLGIVCEKDLCEGFTPPGCVHTGCPDGQICDTTVGCNPSACSCDPNTGQVICTADCGGGTCVPEPPAACCDPLEEPGTNGNPLCFEGHACCPDGTWACSIGDGQTFPCGGELTTGPFGEACEACCDPLEEPGAYGNPFCFEGATCCANGEWSCNQGNGQPSCDVTGIPCEGDPNECDVDADCPSGEVCELSTGCEQPSICVPGCHADSDCSGGEICLQVPCVTCPCPGVCMPDPDPNECDVDADYPSGQVCELSTGCVQPNICVPGCRANSDCSGGEICQQVQCVTCPCPGLCIPDPDPNECDVDADCPSGEVCELSTGCVQPNICVPGCRANSDCSGGEICQQVQCVTCPCPGLCIPDPDPNECDVDADCPSGQVCELSTGCAQPNICVPGCHASSDCNGGEICQQVQCVTCPCPGLCIPDPDPNECDVDADCPSGEVCELSTGCAQPNICVPGCHASSDCNGGEICQQVECITCPCPGICIPDLNPEACDVDADCPSGEVCELSTGCELPRVCVPGCREDSDCEFSGSCQQVQCVTCPCPGICEPPPGPIFCGGIAGITCPTGLTCIDDPHDSCDPDCGGADCGGLCAVANGSQCGGFAGFTCPSGFQCFDAKGDSCSPVCGGADCGGFCADIVGD